MGQLAETLKEILAPALGCTEIGAVGLAAAHARAAASGEPRRLSVIIDINTFKNAAEVIIPNSGKLCGVEKIVALATLYGNPALGLEIFRNLTPELAARLEPFDRPGSIKVETCEKAPPFVDARLETNRGWGRAVISGAHTRLARLENDQGVKVSQEGNPRYPLLEMSVHDIVRLAANPEPEAARLLNHGVEMNLALARAGLEQRPGLALGAHLQDLVQAGMMAEDGINESKILVAAGVDARMSGLSLSAMTNGGSGNQGIATFVPVAVMARRLGSSTPDLLRALALGNLLAAYTKLKIGALTTLCGSGLAAAIGASAGILWLVDRQEKFITHETMSIVANITGMLCGGANETCPLKLATSSGVAVESALLNLRHGSIPPHAAILGETVEKTIDNLILINKSMAETDRAILSLRRDQARRED
jgi:L-cysteine desulfidase